MKKVFKNLLVACISIIMISVYSVPVFAGGSGEAERSNDISLFGTDTTQPKCTDVKIKDANVVRPGYLTVTLTFDERETGINYFNIIAFNPAITNGNHEKVWEFYQESAWGNDDPTGEWHSTTSDHVITSIPKRALFNDTITVDLPVSNNMYTGQWEISRISMSDMARNSGMLVRSDNDWSFYVSDEFDYQFESALSNPFLIEQMASLEDGRTAKILIDTNTVVPKEVFDAIKGSNKKVVAYNKNYEWIFDGNDIVNETKNVDVKIQYSTISKSEFNTNETACIINFQPNGILPGKAEVRIASDYAYDLYNRSAAMYLYYIDNYALEQESNANIGIKTNDERKYCTFDIYHNSKYLLSGSKAKGNCSVKGHSYSTKSYGGYCYSKVCSKCGLRTNYMSKSFVKSLKVSKGTKSFTVKWKKQSASSRKAFTGYRIKYSTNSSMSGAKTVYVSKTSTSKKVSKLKSHKRYYVEVSSYAKKNGVKYYGPKVKKSIVTR